MKKLLIAVAISEEMKIIKRALTEKKTVTGVSCPMWEGLIGGWPVECFVSSMGCEAAAQAASQVIDPARHAGVLVLGYCGGLSLTLHVGDAVIASKVRDLKNSPPIETDVELAEKLGKALVSLGITYRHVPLITSDKVIERADDKRKLFDDTQAEAVDMETFEIMRAARQKDVRSMAMKVVIDDVETELPPINDYLSKTGKSDNLHVKRALMSHPGLSLQLSKFMKIGAQTLEKALPALVTVLCEQWGVPRAEGPAK